MNASILPVYEILEKVEDLRKLISHSDELDEFVAKLQKAQEILKHLDDFKDTVKKLQGLNVKSYLLKDYWTPDDLADFLGISKSRVYRLSCENVLPTYKPKDKNVYFKRTDVYEMLERGKIPSEYEINERAQAAACQYELEHMFKPKAKGKRR